jgi:cytochrome c oxidase cbb3-type subunit 3
MFTFGRSLACVWAAALCLSACQAEKRDMGPAAPTTPPTSVADPRIRQIESNNWQVSEGGRLFAWYGCQACHGEAAKGALDLADNQWHYGGEAPDVYRSIMQGRPGMPGFAAIPADQLWQLTAYVRRLSDTRPSKRRRADADQASEPSGTSPAAPP